MKLSRSVSYAVGILLRLQQEGGGPLTAARISKGCRFPPRFLYRVLRRLVAAGVLRGVSGPGGGYALAREAGKISLWDIVVAAEGRPAPTKLAPVHARFKKAMDRINGLMKKQLAADEQALRKLSLLALAKK